ncbi:MAG: hypothetical protein ABWZ76_02250 [Acidimicrobiales bacterium]
MLVLVILGLIWAAVLLPPYLQNRRETRPGDSIATFRTQLSVLERTSPGRSSNPSRLDVGRYEAPRYTAPAARRAVGRSLAAPAPSARRRAEARRRRRDVFLTLLGAVCVTFVLAVAMGGAVWMLHVAVDVVFGAFVLLLVSIQQQQADQEQKVRYLQPTAQARRAPQSPLLLRRSGS